MLELYHMDACPYCKKVRDAIDLFGLDVTYHEINQDEGAEEKLIELGGKRQVPFLVDTQEGRDPIMMYESDDIIEYLKRNYTDIE